MILPILQIVVSILLVILILLQERSAGMSGIFGGEESFYRARRGIERAVFWSTIALAFLFVGLAIAQLAP